MDVGEKMKNFILIIMLLTGSHTIHASILDGRTVSYQYYFPDLNTPLDIGNTGDYLVDAGVEIVSGQSGFYSADWSDTNLFVDFHVESLWSPRTFNGFLTSDTDSLIPSFLDMTFSLDTNMDGLDMSRIYIEEDRFGINWNGLEFTADTFISLDFESPATVPVPAAIWFMGSGLLGLMGYSRERNSPVAAA